MLRVGKSVRLASAKRRSRKDEPSGSGVNLLKRGMITAGATSIKNNWKTITSTAAQTHQFGPVHSINCNTSASSGNPSSTARKSALTRSNTQVFRVIVLNPNRSSSLNSAYHENGKLTMVNARPVVNRKAAIVKTDVPKEVVKLPNPHGNTPLNNRTIT